MFLYFWSSGASFLDFRRKICDRFVKTAFNVSSGDFWFACFFYENLWVISPSPGSEENFLAFWRKNIKKFVKTALYVYKKFLWKIWFLKKFLHFFRVLIKKFAHFREKKLSKRKILSVVIFFVGKVSCLPTKIEGDGFWCSVRTFGRFVKTALYLSERDFWLNCFFYDFFEFCHCFLTVGRKICNIGAEI